MKTYRIEMMKEVCTEVDIEAETPDEAKTKALEAAEFASWCQVNHGIEVTEIEELLPDED